MPNLYVGNLDLSTSEDQLRRLFGTHGAVEAVTIFRHSNVGYADAVVAMTTDIAAQAAIRALHMTMLGQRLLSIHIEAAARPPEPPSTRHRWF